MRFLLVHSPAVGPSTWRPVADALRAGGHEVTVPDLVSAALTGDPLTFVSECVAAGGGDEVALVGHSGAGPLLPLIAAGLRAQPVLTVFVDAGVPPCESAHVLAGDFVAVLQGLAHDGVLPPWSRWFGDDILPTLVPDKDVQRDIAAELPSIPLRFYESVIVLPPHWCERPAAYLLLSDAYVGDAETAAARGWPVAESRGAHLDIAVRADAIASLLLDLVGSGL